MSILKFSRKSENGTVRWQPCRAIRQGPPGTGILMPVRLDSDETPSRGWPIVHHVWGIENGSL